MNKFFKAGLLGGLISAIFVFTLTIGFYAQADKTNFATGVTVEAAYLNSIYGPDAGADGGHVHDGTDNDGHAAKVLCSDINYDAGACIPDSAIEVRCEDVTTWNSAGCASDVCSVDFTQAACDDKLTCDNLDWANADCTQAVLYPALGFASTEFVLLPIEYIHEGVIGNDPFVTSGGLNDGRFVTSVNGLEKDFFFSTMWRPPTLSTVASTQIRLLYTCDETDAIPTFTLDLDSADEPINDALTLDNIYTATELNCSLALRATTFTNFNAGDADSDDGFVVFYGHVNALTDADPTWFNPLALEIKYVGTKE